MRQLREFAQHKSEFDRLHVRVVGVSVDDQEHARMVWEKVTGQQFTILSDPGAMVTQRYGLLHEKGRGDSDIAIRTTLFIDAEGRERWRRVSETIPDIPKAEEALKRMRETQ
jgi:peroxiredoxin